MELDKKAIKDLAIRELQYNTGDPFEATLRGLVAWMAREGLGIKKQDPPECPREAQDKQADPKG